MLFLPLSWRWPDIMALGRLSWGKLGKPWMTSWQVRGVISRQRRLISFWVVYSRIPRVSMAARSPVSLLPRGRLASQRLFFFLGLWC